MPALIPLIISLLTGAIGGTAARELAKKLGPLIARNVAGKLPSWSGKVGMGAAGLAGDIGGFSLADTLLQGKSSAQPHETITMNPYAMRPQPDKFDPTEIEAMLANMGLTMNDLMAASGQGGLI